MLEHHADFQACLAQMAAFGAGNIETAHVNAAAGGRFQAVEQADQRAFARAAVADDAVNLPGVHRQTDVVYRHYAALCAVKSFANVRKNDHNEADPYRYITAFRPERVAPDRDRSAFQRGTTRREVADGTSVAGEYRAILPRVDSDRKNVKSITYSDLIY